MALKGRIQNSARNESERDSADQAIRRAYEREAKHYTTAWDVVGAGMRGNAACVTEGGLGSSDRSEQPAGTGDVSASKHPGAVEESERFIVAMTPGESREQRRDRSQGRWAMRPGARD